MTSGHLEMLDIGSRSKPTHPGQLGDSTLLFLKKLGLEKFYPNKLTLKSLLEINSASVTDEEVDSLKAIPWASLKKLLMVNSNSRSVLCAPGDYETNDLFADEESDSGLNTLDLYTALFACADSFLQQQMVLKMSMCQFAVPFLLPQGIHDQCTLMIWPLRGIMKEWRPHSMSESKGFAEDSVVHAQIPLISFVRLSDCSLSKSQVLNQVLNKSQQHHDFFSHREMIGGSAPRVIADGMVELCWNLPCGNSSIDIFPEPVAIANLRGDVCTFEVQFCFLTQVSAAVFVFLDSVNQKEQRLLATLQETRSKVFFVLNTQGNLSQDAKSSIKAAIDTLQLEREHIIKKSQKVNLANFSNMIQSVIRKVINKHQKPCNIESMKEVAHELGIVIDEIQSKSSVSAERKAEEIIHTIGVRQITEYKETQLPLQGENWKRLAQIEKEQYRLQNAGEHSLEVYKSQLQKEKNAIWNKQSQYTMTKVMNVFINAFVTFDNTERAFFLKWLGLKLDLQSRKDMSKLRQKYTQCEQDKNRAQLAQLDKELLDSSLGIEHYMREMGQIYEATIFNSANKSDQNLKNLPIVAAKLLLDGFPLELLDGDASNIPEKWVRDVLKEIHRMVGQKSRLLVLTVLGVQSTGKSTLLNTMFGVQFAVSSGRCTRGAYMLFLPVGEDLKEELQCDFILLVDTEGLKSPALATLEDSYEHDNELATFVIGLSDVTIINIAMENSTEMKDILQIAVHAFLRMKEVGKKTVCLFVHQNVAGVSAHDKNKTDRNQLMEQLNEMTVIAAQMEKQPHVKKFTDVLDYDVEKNNWYIPGLWHGTPPMAPVNTGYSAAVFDFKRNLLEMLKARKDEERFQIPDFLKWMSSLWRAVKFENFIFSFRNTLVAHAYEDLCQEYSEWEWSFRRHILSWISSATVQLSNTDINAQSIHEVLDPLQDNAAKEIASQVEAIMKKLKDYYKRKDRHVQLVEKYKTDFANGIKFLESEMKDEVRRKLEAAVEMKANKKKVEQIHRTQATMIEQQVLLLLENNKHRNDEMSDDELKADFDSMWEKEVTNITGLPEKNVPADVFKHLRASLAHRKVTEDLQKVSDLTQCGRHEFEVQDKHVKLMIKMKSFFTSHSAKQDLNNIAIDVINNCTIIIEQHAQLKNDYQETFTKDVLETADAHLRNAGSKVGTKFELDLKLHVCGIASRKFLEMHKRFLDEQDPLKHLNKFKTQYLSDFIDLYRKDDQSKRKAQDFVQLCLKPAVIEFIDQSLGTDIVDAILENNSTEYGSRVLFQYTIQKELLEELNFKRFERYILHYETSVKRWIFRHIFNIFSKDKSLENLKIKKLNIISETIIKAVESSKSEGKGSLLPDNAEGTAKFIQKFCKSLSNDLLISTNTVEAVLFQNTSRCHSFTKSLTEHLNDLKQELTEEILRSSDITETLKNVSVKPQDELFKKVFGCGKQCPFCQMPCEAGGKKHSQHHAAVHRPQGLGTCRSVWTKILCEEICTSSVHGNGSFLSHETEYQPHPYKDYRTIYPDWHIAPDMSVEASDYWKFVLVTFNDKFAERYKALPAVYPDEWKNITKEQALISLKSSFNIT